MAGNASNDNRKQRIGLGLVVIVVVLWVMFGYGAYKCADAALNALSQDYPSDSADQIRLWLVIAALMAGVVFAGLKFACQCIYGMVEVAIAAVMAAELAKTAFSKEPFAALIGLAAIAYIVVRGLENTAKGVLVLQEKSRRGEILLGPLRED